MERTQVQGLALHLPSIRGVRAWEVRVLPQSGHWLRELRQLHKQPLQLRRAHRLKRQLLLVKRH